MSEDSYSDIDRLKRRLNTVSSGPGVYLMKNRNGRVLYVGKARNLKKRIASYFSAVDRHSLKTAHLVQKIHNFDTIVTNTEKEALILEANLIKRYRPKYNVTLKDDKRYPVLRLNVKDDFPHLQIVRKMADDGALYFGPYSSAYAVRQTLKFVHKTFRLRKCCTTQFQHRKRSCLNYQIGTCLGPCCHRVDKKTYDDVVKEVILFLRGRTPDLIQSLNQQMHLAAQKEQFEDAASFRDKIFALRKTLERQVTVMTDFMDRDVIALVRSPELAIITILFVRSGLLIDRHHFGFSEVLESDAGLMSAFIQRYYEKGHYIPEEILVSISPEDEEMVTDHLRALKGKKINLFQPRRGEKVKLVKMAIENAEKEHYSQVELADSRKTLLEKLQRRLHLDRIPHRIECFDNSNLAGTEPVSAMVVFENGKPLPSGYRKYKIRTVSQPDDYGSMDEILRRRFNRIDEHNPMPDLLMVDGGKGQLNIAVSVLKSLHLEHKFDVIAIAKKDESKGETEDKIYKVAQANPVMFGNEKELLLFLQRIRDESHRFVITFHRNRRTKQGLRSVLDGIAGIGPKRKRMLLSHFGSIENIRAASHEQIAALPGINMKIASAITSYLENMR